MAYMPASSKEMLRVSHDADAAVFPVEIAIILEDAGEPADSDYRAAVWDGTDATLIIGAGTSMVLAPGEYVVWTRVTTPTERPVRRSGVVTVGTP
ncbi:hypothetical protein [Nonomuraea sp. 10N515B]|uniref:hypothetical protein n=1 Tax=Nonomuraea sp. 10N515B TaxID=3457422 RepID=UPI003FCD3CFC